MLPLFTSVTHSKGSWAASEKQSDFGKWLDSLVKPGDGDIGLITKNATGLNIKPQGQHNTQDTKHTTKTQHQTQDTKHTTKTHGTKHLTQDNSEILNTIIKHTPVI